MTDPKMLTPDMNATIDGLELKTHPKSKNQLATFARAVVEELRADRACITQLRAVWVEHAPEPTELVDVAGEILIQHAAGTLELDQLERSRAEAAAHGRDVLKLEKRLEDALEALGITHYDELVPAIKRLRDVLPAAGSPLPVSALPPVNFPATQIQVDSLELDLRSLERRLAHVEHWAVADHSKRVGEFGVEFQPRPALVPLLTDREPVGFSKLAKAIDLSDKLVDAAKDAGQSMVDGKPRRVHRPVDDQARADAAERAGEHRAHRDERAK